MSSYAEAVPVGELYTHWGLDHRVFHADEARKEIKLAQVMELPPWYFEVLGTVDETDFTVVVGVRGSGKSALRRRVGEDSVSASLKASIRGTVLCLNIDHDVPYWTEQAMKSGTIEREFCGELADLTVIGIARNENEDSLRAKLTEYERNLLAGFAARLERRKSFNAEKILNAAKSSLDQKYKSIKKHEIVTDIIDMTAGIASIATGKALPSSPKSEASLGSTSEEYLIESLSELVNISRKCGYDAIYVLVDEIDEYPVVGNDPRKAAELIAPILQSLPLLEIKGVAMKFFLSEPVFGEIVKICGEEGREIRWDRTNHNRPFFLAWKDDEIRQMLEKRLRSYSLEKPIKSLDAFASSDLVGVSIDEQVIKFAYRSPRYFIKLAHEIARRTARLANRTDYRVTRLILEEAIDEFCKTTCAELYALPQINALLGLKKSDFTEPEFASHYSLSVSKASEILLQLSSRGALRRVPAIGASHLSIADPRILHLMQVGITDIL
jgi:hypothetical protein